MGEEVAGLVDRQVQFPGSNYCFIFIFSILVIISLLSGFDIDIEKRDIRIEIELKKGIGIDDIVSSIIECFDRLIRI